MRAQFLNRSAPPHIATLILITGLAALTMNIFLPSLPGMARAFGVDYSVMQLSVSAYLGVSAALQLAIGPISDRYGRRPVVLTALGLFLLATLGTLLAPSAGWFLTFRMLQAVIAGGMVLSRAIVRDMVPGEEAVSMIGYVTMGMSLVPMIGPIIGGALDEAYGWRANFALLGVLGVAVLVLVFLDLGETGARREGGFAAQAKHYPALFSSQRFWGYCLASTLSSGAFFAYLGGAPFVGGEIFHLSPATVGYFFAAPGIGYALGNFASARWSVKLGMDRMVFMGTTMASLALVAALLIELAGLVHPAVFFTAVGLMAVGNGMTLPNTNVGMMSVRPELAGTASGLGGAMAIGGGAALSALAGVVLVPGSGAAPLLALMLVSSLGSIAAIRWVIARRLRLGL